MKIRSLMTVILACTVFGMVGCSSVSVTEDQTQPGNDQTLPPMNNGGLHLEPGELLVKIGGDGTIIPLTSDGVPYESCSQGRNEKKRACLPFVGKVTLTGLDDISITRLRYTGSGECEMIVHYNAVLKKKMIYYNPNDPDCREHMNR